MKHYSQKNIYQVILESRGILVLYLFMMWKIVKKILFCLTSKRFARCLSILIKNVELSGFHMNNYKKENLILKRKQRILGT